MVHLPVLRRSAAGAVGALLHDEWAAAFPDPGLAPTGTRRARIWDIAPNLHCSVVGTCLSTGELCQFFVKLGDADARTATDHTLHGRGVRLAGQCGTAGKLLHKTLCRQAGKPFVPLRSASIASFIAAIAAPPIEVEDP